MLFLSCPDASALMHSGRFKKLLIFLIFDYDNSSFKANRVTFSRIFLTHISLTGALMI
jgi:hypothetical protein